MVVLKHQKKHILIYKTSPKNVKRDTSKSKKQMEWKKTSGPKLERLLRLEKSGLLISSATVTASFLARSLSAVTKLSAWLGGFHSGFVSVKWMSESSVLPSSACVYWYDIGTCNFAASVPYWLLKPCCLSSTGLATVCHMGFPCFLTSIWAKLQTSPTPFTSTVKFR